MRKLFDKVQLPKDVKKIMDKEYDNYINRNYLDNELFEQSYIENSDISEKSLLYFSKKLNIDSDKISLTTLVFKNVYEHIDELSQVSNMTHIFIYKSNNKYQLNVGQRERILKKGNVIRFNSHTPHSVEYLNHEYLENANPAMILVVNEYR